MFVQLLINQIPLDGFIRKLGEKTMWVQAVVWCALSREDSTFMTFHLGRGLGVSSVGGGITGVLTHAWISP